MERLNFTAKFFLFKKIKENITPPQRIGFFSPRLQESPKSGIIWGMNILLQIGIVLGICLVGEAISSILPFILPGNIIGMILIFILLLVRVMKVDHIRQKAQFLKQNMAFFLVPASVSIIKHMDLLKKILIPLLVISMVSTILTFLTTAFAVNLTMKLTQKKTTSQAHSQGENNE